MLKLFNKEHVAISALTNLKDYKIEYLLSGEDSLEFSLSIADENIHLVKEEGYVRTKYNEYVIKAIDPTDNFKRYSCVVNIEDIKGKSIANFDTSNNITDTIRLAIAGTGWILADNNISKRRTVRLKNTNALEVLREVRKIFRVDFRYDAINKIIYVYEQFGEDKGVYFSDELNLKSFSIPSDTYDYATRLYCYGKDGLNISSVNNGKEYIDNFQYSNKIIELIWEDNRYTDVNSLKEDAQAKLDELSKPKRSYQADIVDLAKQNEEYKFLDFFLGDTITLLSKQEKFRDKQRIVKYIEYPNNPTQNTCELGNTTLTFEELQKENEAKNSMLDAITSDNGTIDGSKVDSITTKQISDFEASVAKITDLTVVNAEITNLKAQNVTITGKLTAVEGEFGTLKANVGVIDKLTVTHTAQINELKANSATIIHLEATNAVIKNLEANVGKIQTLVNGNLSSENIQAGGITSDKLTIANGFITNAMIANLDVSKINSGDISTNKFKIKSDDGGIEIVGATQQFKDKNNRVRIQMGQDAKGNFNFIIRGEDGTSTLIDHTGVKEKAIADDLIKNNMIASDAVGEKQINYSSFVTGFNKDTNTSTIKSTKIMLNNQNQTLDVAFSQLKTQADGTKTLTESHSTTIGVMQGQISTAINNTQIVKDGQTILLKDDYNRTVQTIDSMKSIIGSHTSQISGLNSTVSTQGSSIEQLKGQIALKVEQTDITNAVNNIQIGLVNLLLNSNGYSGTQWRKENVTILSDTYKGSRIHTTSSAWGGVEYWVSDLISRSVLELNTYYTMSCYARSSASTYLPQLGFYGDSSYHTEQGKILGNVTTEWKQYSVTFKFTNISSGNYKIRFEPLTSSTNGETLQVCGLQLVKGNKIGDWTPAPEDTQSQIDSNKTEITTVKSNVASIDVSLKGITQRVESTETTTATLATKVNTAQSTANTANSNATNALNKAETANSKIDGLEMGGRNLILNSTLLNNSEKWYFSNSSNVDRFVDGNFTGIKLNTNGGYAATTETKIKANKTYTITYFRKNTSVCNMWIGFYFSDNTYITAPGYINEVCKDWKKYTHTFTIPDGKSGINLRIYSYTSGVDLYIRNIKVCEGESLIYDWTPAPEDTQGQLDAHTTQITTTNNKVASIETNLSSITSRVSSVEQTQVSTNGKVTSLETWKKDAEKKITSDAIISTVTSSQTYKDALTGKVSTNQIISSINQTAEAIKIQANKIDMTGELDLQGRFKCWKNNSDKTGNYLHLNGAMMFGYNKTGGNNPVFASGLWTDENMGYFSVGYTRADITDANGCLYMSPQEGNQGGRLTFSRLKDSQVAHTTLYFQKDGAIDFYSGLRGLYENDDNYTYRFDAGTSVKALRCNRLRSYDIYPRGNNTYDIGFTNGGCFSNIWGNNICTNQSHLYLGTAQASGAWNTYGALAINSATGYIFPAKYNGALGLGMSNNRFSGLYSVNAVNVSSDSRLKTDIHYLEEPTGETVILENRVERNMHITTKDMYDFVKNELKLASYRYNTNLEKGNTCVDYGFIAQDILYTKVGSEIVQLADKYSLNSELSYNQGNYISVIAGALQQEIRKRDKEIKELRLEIENLKSQRKLEVA